MRELLLDVLHQADAIAIGQAHVGQAQVRPLPRDDLPGFLQCGGAMGLQTHTTQCDIQQLSDIRFIIHDQDTLGCHL